MRARFLRAFYLCVLAVMVAAYVVEAANSQTPNDLFDSFTVVGDQWC